MFNLDFIILGSSLQEWSMFILVSFVSFIILKIFEVIVLKRMKLLSAKTKTQIDDMFIDAIDSIRLPFYIFSSIYIATFFTTINSSIEKAISYIFLISSIYYIIRFLEKIIDYGVEKITASKEKKDSEGIIKFESVVLRWP